MERILGFKPGDSQYELKDLDAEVGNLLTYFDVLIGIQAYDEVLALCDSLEAQHGPRSLVLRERGRAIEELHSSLDALPIFRQAVLMPDADDTSAIWYGNTFNNRREYVNAAEAYLVACRLDPSDGRGFAHLAQSIARHQKHSAQSADARIRRLPQEIDENVLYVLFAAAMSCKPTKEVLSRLAETAVEMGTDFETVMGMHSGHSMSVAQRLELVAQLYALFKSPVTSAEQGSVVLQ